LWRRTRQAAADWADADPLGEPDDNAGDYVLTEIGERLKPAMRPLLDWSVAWDKVMQSRD
jgi:hypothetical protein